MIYFDNAATTLKKPQEVKDAIINALNTMGNAERSGHNSSLDASRMIYDTRKRLVYLFHGSHPSEIVFTHNATHSLNIAIKGLFEKGDHIITTSLEHNSVLRPLYEIEHQGVELSFLDCDDYGCICIEDIYKSIKDNTKAIICTHASNVTGNIIDIKAIGQICKQYNLLFIVDASQTAGVIDIDVKEMNIDVLCFTGHKGLLGPQGTGGMYVRQGIKIRPLLSGGSGILTFLKNHPDTMPTALEAGTLNTHGIAGLNAALKYIEDYGIENIRNKERMLMMHFYQNIKDLIGVSIYGDFRTSERCAIVSINIEDYPSSYISDILYNDYGICTRSNTHCAPLIHQALKTEKQGMIRFSFSHFNTLDEVNNTIKILKELLNKGD